MEDRREEPRAEEPKTPTPEGGTFKIWFGTENVELALRAGQTLKDVFRNKAEALSLDFDRRLQYRDNDGNLLTGEEAPVAGREYIAAITHDSKGV